MARLREAVAGWLLGLARWLAPVTSAPPDPPATPTIGAGNEHWLAVVRERAPQLLEGQGIHAGVEPPARAVAVTHPVMTGATAPPRAFDWAVPTPDAPTAAHRTAGTVGTAPSTRWRPWRRWADRVLHAGRTADVVAAPPTPTRVPVPPTATERAPVTAERRDPGSAGPGRPPSTYRPSPPGERVHPAPRDAATPEWPEVPARPATAEWPEIPARPATPWPVLADDEPPPPPALPTFPGDPDGDPHGEPQRDTPSFSVAGRSHPAVATWSGSGADPWPELPDDTEVWSVAMSAWSHAIVRRLDAEQRGR